MYIIIIEWDGKQPPTRFYSTLHRMGVRVRVKKTENDSGPISRRVEDTSYGTVAIQEGVYLATSRSTAIVIAQVAKQCGAPNVSVGEIDFPSELEATDPYQLSNYISKEDKASIQAMMDTFTRRGRPKANKGKRLFVVTCRECCRSTEVLAYYTEVCPHCGSINVMTRAGTTVKCKAPASYPRWLETRFRTSRFEIPEHVSDGQSSFKNIMHQIDQESLDVIREIRDSKRLFNLITFSPTVPEEEYPYSTLLDNLFLARRYYTAKARQTAKVNVAVLLYKNGFAQDEINMFDDSPSILDIAVINKKLAIETAKELRGKAS